MKSYTVITQLYVITFAIVLQFNVANMAAVMSVDLGSEWMKVGVISPGVPMEIALNKESKRKTPMYIGFRGDTRVFGEDAQTLNMRFPSTSFGYLNDLIGKSIENPVVDLYKSRFPWYTIKGDPTRNTVVFQNGNESHSVEELLAQILAKAKEFAEDYTGQQVNEVVIIVPGFFGQAERKALIEVAKLANLRVLQLMNDYTAVALNYGIFRSKEINETAQYFIFYDMGAYKTSAAVVSYQLVKDKITREKVPSLQVLGVAYDRNLGGLEMQTRLRDHLGKKFNEMKKTKTDVFTNPRAMAKLFKEAGRVKNVLSANTEFFAQIEGLLDEKDFRVQVTRQEFETLCSDLIERAPTVLKKALDLSGLTLDTVNQVVLFGGNTRVPKVQEVLRSTIKTDLAKNINSDEAAAMGGVYRAADLTTGFKVKKFLIQDAVLFPIQAVFERKGESGIVKQSKRTLFGPMSTYPFKKVITFNKYTEDFTFDIVYDDLNHIIKEEVEKLGNKILTRVQLSGLQNILEKHSAENINPKGIKAHFSLDDSGIFDITNVEMVLEKSVLPEDNENAFQKISNTISKLFVSENNEAEDLKSDEEKDNNTSTESSANAEAKPENNTSTSNSTVSGATNKTEAAKQVTIKEPIVKNITIVHVKALKGDQFTESLKKVDHYNNIENEKRRLENALNALESYVIDTQLKLGQEEYFSCSTEEETNSILKACSEISEWIYDEGSDVDAETYEEKLRTLTEIANPVYARHWEHNERPEALNALKSMINGSLGFLATAKNLTKDANPERDVFTQVEIDNLEKAIRDTIDWQENEIKAQEKLARNEPVQLTVKSIIDKTASLDREVKYLVNKIKLWRPKVLPKESKHKKDTKPDENKTESSGDSETKSDENIVEKETEEIDEQETNDNPQTDEENHSEL